MQRSTHIPDLSDIPGPPTKEEAFHALLRERNISAEAFKPCGIEHTSPPSVHLAWIHKHILSVPYTKADTKAQPESKDMRIQHGTMHAVRVAMYIIILVNYLRRKNVKSVLNITPEILILLLITAFFHDAGRLRDGNDEWDEQSAQLCFHYMTKVLGLDDTCAEAYADIIRNKDSQLFKILILLLHDGDSLDIKRARFFFNADFLTIFKSGLINNLGDEAFEELAQLFREINAFIEMQGDGPYGKDYQKKKLFEHASCWDDMVKMLMTDLECEAKDAKEAKGTKEAKESIPMFPMMRYLFGDGTIREVSDLQKPLLRKLPPFDAKLGLTEQNMAAGLAQGLVLARAIPIPCGVRAKDWESNSHLEFRKMAREPGVLTQTSHADGLLKDGNRNRSTALVGNGAPTYSSAGLFIFNYSLADIKAIFAINAATQRGKRKELDAKLPQLEDAKKAEQMAELVKRQKKGGPVDTSNGYATTEIIYHIRKRAKNALFAVFYTQDPVRYNYAYGGLGSYHHYHRHGPALEALFIYHDYIQVFNEQPVIVEYSGIYNFIKIRTFSHEDIVRMWTEMCMAYCDLHTDEIKKRGIMTRIDHWDLHHLKVLSMYGRKDSVHAKEIGSADANYPTDLKEKVNAALDELLKKYKLVWLQAMTDYVKEHPMVLLRPGIDFLGILSTTQLQLNLKTEIQTAIQARLADEKALTASLKTFELSSDFYRYYIETSGKLADVSPGLENYPEVLRQGFDTIILRMWSFAVNLKLRDEISAIQIMVIPFIHKAVLEVQANLEDEGAAFPWLKFVNLVRLISFFDCYKSFEHIIKKLATSMIEACPFEFYYNIRHNIIRIFFDFLHETGILKTLDESVMLRIREKSEEFCLIVSSGICEMTNVLACFDLAKYLDIPAAVQKQLFFDFLRNRPFAYGGDYVESLIQFVNSQQWLDDQEIFRQLIVTHTRSVRISAIIDCANKMLLETQFHKFVLRSVLINKFQTISISLPAKKFNSWQRAIVSDELNKIYDLVLHGISTYSPLQKIEMLLVLVDELLNFQAYYPIPVRLIKNILDIHSKFQAWVAKDVDKRIATIQAKHGINLSSLAQNDEKAVLTPAIKRTIWQSPPVVPYEFQTEFPRRLVSGQPTNKIERKGI